MENKKGNAFNDFIKPVLVLVIICFVVTLALAMTYGVTHPIIEESTKAAADATRTELLPKADGFEEYTGELAVLEEKKVYIQDCYKATNGEGIVVTAVTNSYGGALVTMVGIDKDGALTKVVVTDSADTPGVGTKAQEPGHLDQYAGLKALNSEDIKQEKEVKPVTGATVSSGAIHKAVYVALEQYKMMGGAK